jgi:hypothetical protein
LRAPRSPRNAILLVMSAFCRHFVGLSMNHCREAMLA